MLSGQPFKVEGDRAYGLGIADDKQGISLILHTLAMLRALNFREYGTLTVLINGDEEISSPGSRFLIEKLGREHDAVLSFEGGGGPKVDQIRLATSGIGAATLTVRGRASHAGAAPHLGVNALYELSHQILQARDLSNPKVGSHLNWTMARAGIVRNMIPPGAQAQADVRVDRVADLDGVERATALLTAISGGVPGPVVEASAPGHLPVRPAIHLRRGRIGRILGVSVDDPSVEDFLVRLGRVVSRAPDGWDVVPPSRRFDVAIEVDLIEEVGRIFGFPAIPAARSLARVDMHAPAEAAFDLDRAKQALVARDYQEAITYSFVHPSIQQLLDPGQPPIALANPISAEMSVMRTTPWAGLLGVLAYNQARQQERVRIFESGLKFTKKDNEIKQENALAGVVCGAASAEQWGIVLDIFIPFVSRLFSPLRLGRGATLRFSLWAL